MKRRKTLDIQSRVRSHVDAYENARRWALICIEREDAGDKAGAKVAKAKVRYWLKRAMALEPKR